MLQGFGETQQKLLYALLQNKEGMTIASLVASLNISRTAVNQHISALEKASLLEKFTVNSHRGRPGQAYKLSDRGLALFPKQYVWFSKLLIQYMKSQMGKEGLEKVMADLGENIALQFSTRLQGKSEADKTQEITDIMQELGYESQTDQSDQIKACNCVYHDLALENPEICTFDLALISAMSGREVTHTECMVRGGNRCRFQLKHPLDQSTKSQFETLEDSTSE